ncbi:TetR/AcrR family transcriptional regulator [Nodularia sp. UHCC 0506]|uniref:TetR/AcrR family transcriptional regulator n=1 Tax=Nodularia sp. UHCC 0506 TaxID=3110243 RepID=UPI002B1EE056|nr:TetR/AcrR family transcriptional regulator [Nodularia sp. UHCC 0506]MEA5516267.1 TetR/AcrR family transcriptional regulator [Nodularia sp. UHCC 0506]
MGMRRKPLQARSQERVNRILDVATDMFITDGYNATTTNAIATRARVPIGSLYQFFPDKSAIMQALAMRYGEMLRQELKALDNMELAKLPLSAYVDQLIETTEQFYAKYPGYYTIFMEVQGTIPELAKIEDATDTELIQDLATSLAQRDARLEPADYQAISYVLVKTVGVLLWLSFSQENEFRQRVVAETKRFTLSYLQSYFP